MRLLTINMIKAASTMTTNQYDGARGRDHDRVRGGDDNGHDKHADNDDDGGGNDDHDAEVDAGSMMVLMRPLITDATWMTTTKSMPTTAHIMNTMS